MKELSNEEIIKNNLESIKDLLIENDNISILMKMSIIESVYQIKEASFKEGLDFHTEEY